MMLPPQYVAYHEAGHAVALHNSRSHDLDYIEFDHQGARAKPMARNGGVLEPTRDALLDKAIIACAGMCAGGIFLERAGLPQNLPGIEEGLQRDLESCYSALESLSLGCMHQTFATLTSDFIKRPRIWIQVEIVAAELLSIESGLVSGDRIRQLLSTTLPKGGEGLPRPFALSIRAFFSRMRPICP